jgi:hypothetical protein
MQCFAAKEFKSTITYTDGTEEVIDAIAYDVYSTIQRIMVDVLEYYCVDDRNRCHQDQHIQFEVLGIPRLVKVGSEIFWECSRPDFTAGLSKNAARIFFKWQKKDITLRFYIKLLDGDYALYNNPLNLTSRYQKLKRLAEKGSIVRIANGTVQLLTDPASL